MSMPFVLRTAFLATRRFFVLQLRRKYAVVFFPSTLSTVGVALAGFLQVRKVLAETTPSQESHQDAITLPELQSWHYERFSGFASLEFDGELFLSPSDFVRCASGVTQSHKVKRRVLSESEVKDMIRSTPSLSQSTPFLFRDLGCNGIVSFTEYLFLISILTHPRSNLHIAFKLFDRDCNDQVDLAEFRKITSIFSCYYAGKTHGTLEVSEGIQTTLSRHLFGKSGTSKLKFDDFSRFVDNLQSEVLLVEFNHFAASQRTMQPIELGRSLIRFAKLTSKVEERLSKLESDASLTGKTIDFGAYKALFNFLYVIDDFSSALQMFILAKTSISKIEFQRAARAVTGAFLDPVVVDTIFVLFDADGDGHLSSAEFIEAIRARGLSSRASLNHNKSRLEAFRRCVGRQLYHS